MMHLPIRRSFPPTSSRFRLACLQLEDRLAPATITITTIADNTALDGKVSLREALTSANNNANLNADVVAVGPYGTEDLVFDAALFATPQSIKLLTALPSITGDVNFNGTSAANVTVTRDTTAPALRIFNCGIAGFGGVTFSNMTISGGSATANGAGIFAADDGVTISNCVIANNVTTTRGGGISFITGGIVVVINSTISGNSSQGGGGIYCFNTGTLIIDNCTISGNTASGSTGGAGILDMSSTVAIRNSTISGNHATAGAGGGITLQNAAAAVTIQNSTIAFNDATTTGGGIQRTNGTLSIESVVVAKNTAVTDGADVFGTVNFAKFNLIGEIDGATGITDPSNKTGTKASPLNPLLGALTNNGGPTQTHIPAATSPLINKGSNPAALSTDQRGSGVARVSGSATDIGAVEIQLPSVVVSNANNSGVGSLRQAIVNANATPGSDTITFDPAFFSSAKAISQGSGEILITDAVAIIGPAAKVTINGNGTSRVFNTSGAAADMDITIESLTITLGNGAILVGDEDLTLTNCTITGNTSVGGGAIYVQSALGTLNLLGCTVSNNSVTGAGNKGGAILLNAASFVLIQDTTISGNTCAGTGGGVAFNNGGSLLMLNSTLSSNTASGGDGGAVHFSGTAPLAALNVVNSTISGNSAVFSGGGFGLSNFAGTLTIQNCTITNNTANGGVGGGGIARTSGTGTISLESSIGSGNTNATAPDIFSAGMVNLKTSAIGSGTGFSKTDLGGNLAFQPHANLLLGSLTNNGGPTLTHFVLRGSPVIDKGSNTPGLTADQRGASFLRVSGPAADIGAIERPSTVVCNTADSGNGSLRQSVDNANTLAGADTITFDAKAFLTPQTITLTTGEIAIDEDVTITGPTARVTIDGNANGRIFDAAAAGDGAAVVLENLNITNGKASGGGAIDVGQVDFTLQDCSITNSASDAGGAMAGFGNFVLTIRRSTLSGNTASAVGGALAFASIGGSVYNPQVGRLIVEDSTLSGNTCTTTNVTQGGGAIYFYGFVSPEFRISNTTLSGNSAPGGSGGAVLLKNINGSAVFESCTISGNSAGADGGGIARLTSSNGTLSINSTILAGNTNANAPDLAVPPTASKVSGSRNLIGVADAGNFILTGSGNLTGTKAAPLDAKLGALMNNGGSTQTHFPLASSPAVDNGNNPGGFVNDQRGAGFPRLSGKAPDIGAVERSSTLVFNSDDSGNGSLRQAVLNANATIGPDTVTFDPTAFTTLQKITLTTGEIAINEAITITGPGSGLLTVSGNNASRVMNLGFGLFAVSLSGLTFTQGKAASGGSGGAIVADAHQLVLANCVFAANTASSDGGAVFLAGDLTATGCVFVGNSAGGVGGAVVCGAFGKSVLQRCTVNGNTAAQRGGLAIVLAKNVLVEDSTISGNSATNGKGGGLYITGIGVSDVIIVRNSTVSGNSAQSVGGGICLNSAGQLQLLNSTVAANQASTGGGIGHLQSGTIALISSIVSVNTGSAPDISSTGSVTLDFSAVGSASGFTPSGGPTNLPFGTDLKLGPLANNGGPTLTHGLLAGSPAINAGSNSQGLTNDQRGTGFARSVNGSVDIGAFEVQAAPPRLLDSIINGGLAQRSRVTQVQFTFSTVVTLPVNPETAFQLKRNSDNALIGLVAQVTNGTTTNVTLTFTGALVESGSLPDGRYALTIFAAQVTANGFQLDGNGDGVAGDDHVVISSGTGGIFRLFGDVTGDASVAANDFIQFRLSLGGNNPTFDFDVDGAVAASDFIQFRVRFGGSI